MLAALDHGNRNHQLTTFSKRALVATRALRVGDRLPSVRDLAATLRVNRNTAAKAYQMLETDGVIETRAGLGCFIADGGPRWSKAERYRRVEQRLDRTLVEARHLGVPFEEIPPMLDRRIEAFPEGEGNGDGEKG